MCNIDKKIQMKQLIETELFHLNSEKDRQWLAIKVAQTKPTHPDLQMVFIRSILS